MSPSKDLFKSVRHKINRIASGHKPRVLDIFAGCGGLSLGFQRAGFEISAAIEIDEIAAKSHARNFCRSKNVAEFQLHSAPRDITQYEPEAVVRDFKLGKVDEAIDVLIGGPPCQAYARVGRAKLREIAEHPEAFKIDPRADLYLRYLHYVARLKPMALLMENVPDILNFGGHNVVEEMREALDSLGYNARYSLLNSAHHGVPQMRDRVFLIALHRELNAEIRFPKASHWLRLPSGYEGTRSVALKLINLLEGSGYVAPDCGDQRLPKAVSAAEAVGDLPPITLHLEGKLKRGARRFTELTSYGHSHSLSEYAQQMREWPGFEAGDGIYDHVIRFLPRDTEIFRQLEPGSEYPAAQRLAVQLFEQEARRRRVQRDSREWEALYRKMVPPYPTSSFPNRWWKLRKDAPTRTLMAHLGKDCYSHIHYDGSQARTISVREAARLQSFPDGFVFEGTMNPAFRQIGNAVPPILALAMANSIKGSIEMGILRSGVQVAAE